MHCLIYPACFHTNVTHMGVPVTDVLCARGVSGNVSGGMEAFSNDFPALLGVKMPMHAGLSLYYTCVGPYPLFKSHFVSISVFYV